MFVLNFIFFLKFYLPFQYSNYSTTDNYLLDVMEAVQFEGKRAVKEAASDIAKLWNAIFA